MKQGKRKRVFATGTAATILATASIASGADKYVDDSAPSGGNGDSWTSPYNSLQTGLSNVNSGDRLRVAQGTYKPGTTRSATFALEDLVVVQGGFAGYGALDPNQWAPDSYVTILSGDLNGDDTANFGNISDNSFHVVSGTGTIRRQSDTLPNLWGFTIKGGNSNGATDTRGAGIYLSIVGGTGSSASTPLIKRCRIMNNYGDAGSSGSGVGGGIYAKTSSGSAANLAVINCWIDHNTATGGGGVFLETTNATFISSRLNHNSATLEGGGAVWITGSGQSLTMTNCLIDQNSAWKEGAGIDNWDSTATIVNCTIPDNDTINSDGFGGGYYQTAFGMTSTLTNCIFWGNNGQGSASPSGDQIWNNSGTLNINYSDVEGDDEQIVNYGTLNYDTNTNTDDDPKFILPGSNYRLQCTSPVRDIGNNSSVLCDQFDVDNNGTTCGGTSQDTPDRDRKRRISNSAVDLGSFERIPCSGDATADGLVNIDDLLAVVTSWSDPVPCSSPPPCTGCPGDLYPGQCSGDGCVTQDDLLQVITNWGTCTDGPPGGVDDMPVNAQDCWNSCTNSCPDDPVCWAACFVDCLDALCKQGLLPGCP